MLVWAGLTSLDKPSGLCLERSVPCDHTVQWSPSSGTDESRHLLSLTRLDGQGASNPTVPPSTLVRLPDHRLIQVQHDQNNKSCWPRTTKFPSRVTPSVGGMSFSHPLSARVSLIETRRSQPQLILPPRMARLAPNSEDGSDSDQGPLTWKTRFR
jgi:hypothetical protein